MPQTKHQHIRLVLSILLIIMLSTTRGQSQDKPTSGLERTVTVYLNNEQPKAMLDLISREADVVFSYSPKVLANRPPVTLDARQQPIRFVLYTAFGESVRLKDRGKYIIILDNRFNLQQPFGDKPQMVEGYITDPTTGQRVSNVTIYDKNLMVSATSDAYGYFKIKVPYGEKGVKLRVSKAGYSDTTITPKSQASSFVSLNLPALTVPPGPDQQHKRGILGITFPTWLLSEELWTNSINIGDTIYRSWQLSLLPYIGTNHRLSGNVVNSFSVNIIGGYSQGVRIAEIGGLVNITRKDARYFMASGANHVGGHMLGVQVAGVYNRTQTVTGFQAAGILNKSFGKVNGVQISGIASITPGSLQGVQISGVYSHNSNNSGLQFSGIMSISQKLHGSQVSGVANYGRGTVSVAQLAGIANIIKGKVYGAQVGGIANIADTALGFQMAGIANITVKSVKGFQATGILNSTSGIQGVQLAGILNLADTVSGAQIAGVVNRAKLLKGIQVGLINLADSGQGMGIGLFSYIRKGYHQLELSADELISTGIAFRSGHKRLHNILSVGIRADRLRHPVWSIGYGLGSSWGISNKTDFDVELHSKQLIVADKLSDDNDLYQLYLGINRNLGGNRSVALGLTANVLRYQNNDNVLAKAIPYTLWKTTSDSQRNICGWIGGRVAFRF